jgi:hypothetical protein
MYNSATGTYGIPTGNGRSYGIRINTGQVDIGYVRYTDNIPLYTTLPLPPSSVQLGLAECVISLVLGVYGKVARMYW